MLSTSDVLRRLDAEPVPLDRFAEACQRWFPDASEDDVSEVRSALLDAGLATIVDGTIQVSEAGFEHLATQDDAPEW